ncbi:MAG: LysE family transporter, partial [Rhodobacteraceae bacterium]|nr:LysE family transporter [Paracoccaceae bacterium]
MTAQQALVFLPLAALVAVSPGANNLLAFVNGAQAGWRRAGRALAGRLAAFAIMVVLAALGLGALLERSAFAFGLLKWAGV